MVFNGDDTFLVVLLPPGKKKKHCKCRTLVKSCNWYLKTWVWHVQAFFTAMLVHPNSAFPFVGNVLVLLVNWSLCVAYCLRAKYLSHNFSKVALLVLCAVWATNETVKFRILFLCLVWNFRETLYHFLSDLNMPGNSFFNRSHQFTHKS